MIAKGIEEGRKQVYYQKGLLDTKAFSGFSAGHSQGDSNSDSSGSSCNSNQSYSFSGNDEEQDANGIDFSARWAAFKTAQK